MTTLTLSLFFFFFFSFECAKLCFEYDILWVKMKMFQCPCGSERLKERPSNWLFTDFNSKNIKLHWTTFEHFTVVILKLFCKYFIYLCIN